MMWMRNGNDIRYQAFLYVQNSFCSSFIDLDIFLLQVSCFSDLCNVCSIIISTDNVMFHL